MSIPVSVWVDGEDPTGAQSGQACLVARDQIRLRLPAGLEAGATVRLKTPFRSRSITAVVEGSTPAGSTAEVAISAENIGSYFGIAFPKDGDAAALAATAVAPPDGAGQPPPGEPTRPTEPSEPRTVPQPLPPLPSPEPTPVPLPEPTPVPPRGPAEPPVRSLEVTVSGIDSARCAFIQKVTAELDQMGSLRVPLRQVVDIGGRLRLALPPKHGSQREQHRHCRVYSRSALRTPDGFWVYRLIFEQARDLFREFEPPTGTGAPKKHGPGRITSELTTLRSVLAALLCELRQRGVLEDDTLLSNLLDKNTKE